ncbi:GTP-binding protein [Mucilaginibacter sp. RS28]|uniref:GTP-binding protein n=1 Tax=Mucilaginibacter straminoryzae TaxID=2932774 RepID=A0A9X1X2Y8_9SPHI|nr:GTP-binding protein [Mucilaginibacter straminoryzae]MCJ8209035.1 GTP-binding protein [Mucilaginibacter straminoryzae]
MTSTEPIPVTIISGFLGAGKTTFLNKLITRRKNYRLAVIENEFGEIGIDGDLVINEKNDLFEMNNGCLCCSLNQDFYALLESLWAQHDQYDEIVIETTGIADPALVAAPFLTDQTVSRYFELKRVICLVDARHIETELEVSDEARKQISFSDILLINKTDLVSLVDVQRIEKLLTALNPFAAVFNASKENYPFDELISLDRMKIVQRRPKFSVAPQRVESHSHHNLTSLSFTFQEAFNLQNFELRMSMFLAFQASDIYRMKGILRVEGHPCRIIVQSVHNDLAIGFGEKWNDDEKRESRLVFIGRKLNPEGFERMLKQCLSKSNLSDLI